MLKNYLLVTLRNLKKNKLHIIINILGMATAIGCCIVGYYNYDFNRDFDTNHLNRESIYRVNSIRSFQDRETAYGYVPMALGNVVRQNTGDVTAVRYLPGGGNFRVGTEVFRSGLSYVDREFFDLFTFEFVEGNAELRDKSQLLLNEEIAIKYFGQEKALGKTITEILDSGKTREFVVTGVYRIKHFNNSFRDQGFTLVDNNFVNDPDPEYHENSWRYRTELFVMVSDPARLSSLEAELRPFAANNNAIREDFIITSFVLDPFVGMAVRDEYNDIPGTWTWSASPQAAVVGTGMMGILVLLIACFNLTNTTVAISGRRLKEIGIRKVMGSARKHLIGQYIGETTLICLVSLLLGIAIAEWLLIPGFNSLWPEMKLATNYFEKPNFLIFTGATLLFTSLLAGGYPSLYISRFESIAILKGKTRFGGTNFFTMFLLMLQFAISLTGIVCGFAFINNAQFQKSLDLGFDRSAVVYAYVDNRSEYEVYRNALVSNPDIERVAASAHNLYSNWIIDPVKHNEKELELDIMDVGDDYLEVIGATIIEGRNFQKDSETDRKESVIITEGLARKFGMETAIGQKIVWMDTVSYYVVGVVKDIYNRGLWDQMEPIMFRYAAQDKVNYLLAKTSASKVTDVNAFMEKQWKEVFPNKLYTGNYMDEEMAEAATVNNNIVIMFVFLAIVALFLSATGLFTLVSLNIIKRMKEIGVRKVLGASAGNISRVINTRFVIILSIASALGCAGGYFLSAMLMDSIWDYFEKASAVTLILSVVVLFVACFVSIGYKIYNTTRLNPALVLRDE